VRAVPFLLALGLAVGLVGCGDDPSAADMRADQVHDAAVDAGLPEEVADVLALAARGIDGTYQVTYPGEDGAALVVSQDPPDRRIDVVAGDRIVESRVFRDDVAYECTVPEDDPDGPLDCRRSQGALHAPGAFTDESLDAFAADLAGSKDDLDLSVEPREIAGVEATCLVAIPKAGPTDGTGPGVETICLSDEGGQLLIDAAGERLVAAAYTTDVPRGTFET
jgi:hypothetical protein